MKEIVSLTSDNYGFSSHEAWLEDRKESIGGSDANIIAGNSKYASWYSLWAEKTRRISRRVNNAEAAWLGHVMEDPIAKRFEEESGLEVSFIDHKITNPDHPYSHANIDGWIEETNEGLEIKTCSLFRKDEMKEAYSKNKIPISYYAQCLHYMAVTGADGWWLAVCVLQDDFFIFHIERTEEVEKDIAILMEDERYFWESYMIPDVPPPITGDDPTKDAIELMFPAGKGFVDRPDLEIYLERREEVMQDAKKLKEEKEQMENIIKEQIGDAEIASCGNYRVSWKGSDGKRRFSVKKAKI